MKIDINMDGVGVTCLRRNHRISEPPLRSCHDMIIQAVRVNTATEFIGVFL